MPLQRVITDFGADVPFGQIPKKLLEHHGCTVPISSAQSITQKHAQKVFGAQKLDTEIPVGKGVACLIAEMDGTMIPLVETTASGDGTEKIDRRKTRKISWGEA